jgi:hypothetical protein
MPYCNLASALIDEVLIASMQNHVMDCLNLRLMLNGHQQYDNFEETVTSCFEASLIDLNTSYACITITHKGNKAIHDATVFLVDTFGPPC